MEKVQVSPRDRKILPVDALNITAVRQFVSDRTPEGGRNITIFAAASEPRSRVHTRTARELGAMISAKHNVVWGGMDGGLMGDISRTARHRGAFLIGVAYDTGTGKYGGLPIDFMFGAQTLEQRKKGLIALGDVALALPGGLGTLDEITTYMEHKKASLKLPPLVLLNSDGFYDGLRTQVERMESDRMSNIPGGQLALFPESLETTMMLLSTLQPPKLKQA